MTPFRFRLQRLLELRSNHEQQVAIRLANARETAAARRVQHDALVASHDEGRRQLRDTGHAAGELQALGVMLEHLEQHVSIAATEAREAAEVVCGVESDMRAASQARRVLDRLRERRAEEWRVEVSSNDRATMDAVALTRFVNRPDRATDQS
ncbi:MAG TPA: flagellar FliJ family protein [Gemmatimonadales bacterium]|nr:flagellar FliJ family protein [Gemmatimonadales bacterium]